MKRGFFSRPIPNLIVTMLAVTFINLAVSYGYCMYKGINTLEGYSSALFIVSLIAMLFGGLAYAGSYNSNRDFSFMMGRSVSIGSAEERRKQDRETENQNINFAIKAILSAVLSLAISIGLSMFFV